MPGFDGTGPAGRGAMTGGSRGGCRGIRPQPENNFGRGRRFLPCAVRLAAELRRNRRASQVSNR